MATSPIYSWPEPDNTDLVKNGALAIRTMGDAIDTTMGTMVAKTIIDAKGDLIAGTAADTAQRLAVGNNGETLVADSAATTGLRYSATPSASNPILNSAYQIWQRGTSGAMGGSGLTYLADRWVMYSASVGTVSRQLTGDTTNLPNIQYCARVQKTAAETGNGLQIIAQNIETTNSIPFVGKTVTMSFYARKGANYSSASDLLTGYLRSGTGTDQNAVGAGFTGSAFVATASATLTATWQRFTATGTVGLTATQLETEFRYTTTGTAGAADYFEVTGVQLDVGSVALPFRTYAATIQGELAACQRYYYRQTADATAVYAHLGQSRGDGATSAVGQTVLPVTMRVTPTSVDFSTVAVTDGAAVYAATAVALASNQNDAKFAAYTMTFASGVTQFRYYYVVSNNSATGYLGFNAEL